MWQRRSAKDRPGRDAPESGRITAISQQQRDPSRVSISLDGVFAFGLDANQSVEQGLRIGEELSAARVQELRALDEAGRATSAALGLLARRPRSVREIRDRLRQREFAPSAIDVAIERLEGWRYVDDADFARYWVENRERHKPRGRRLLTQELRQKGVERETVEEVLAAAGLDESAAAADLARSKLRSYVGQEPEVVRRKLGAFLARRGFDYETARRAVDAALDEDPTDHDATG